MPSSAAAASGGASPAEKASGRSAAELTSPRNRSRENEKHAQRPTQMPAAECAKPLSPD